MMKYIGYGLIAVGAIFNLFVVLPIFKFIVSFGQSKDSSGFVLAGIGALLDAAGIFILQGIITINPGDAILMMDSGEYKGTIKKNGEVWAVPTYEKIKVSTK